MIQRFVDDVLAVAKESVKTFTYESLNNIVRLINGISALLLTILPGRGSLLEGVHGWELRPTFRGPRFPRWMENGVSSFNQFIHELGVDSDNSSLDYSSGEEDSVGNVYPSSPSSQSSRGSRAGVYDDNNTNWTECIRGIFFWILLPAKLFFWIPFRICQFYFDRWSWSSSVPGSPRPSIKRAHSHKDDVVHRTTDRRRGVIEDLHLVSEICIESLFDVVHKAAHFLFSPLDALRTLLKWSSSQSSYVRDDDDIVADVTVPTTTLGDDDPVPTEKHVPFRQQLNTDARTCQDVITELGYPYEAIPVVTNDGYVLLLERIPRRDARKALYLQHGVFDSSMGWISNGVVGSPAFAAFDQGFDVYLANLRGLVSREHIDKNISSKRYWNYSLNEHAMEDLPSMIEKIHQVKTSELEPSQHEETDNEQPYKLCAVTHSMGGAALLMYVLTRRIQDKPHRLSRLVLLSPAGFHEDSNIFFTMLEHVLLFGAPILSPFIPALYIPTRFFRMLLNKVARDLHHYPAVGGLVQTVVSNFLGGDSSNWIGVIGLPHYNMNDMPGVSFRVALHLAQMKYTKKFRMFDYGSAAANMEAYGLPEPLDMSEYFGLIDVPVDLVAGQKDQVIRPSMVKRHYKLMKEAGVDVTYNEFEYAHLDFTFSHREELLAFIMSRLELVDEAGMKRKPAVKVGKSRRKEKPDG